MPTGSNLKQKPTFLRCIPKTPQFTLKKNFSQFMVTIKKVFCGLYFIPVPFGKSFTFCIVSSESDVFFIGFFNFGVLALRWLSTHGSTFSSLFFFCGQYLAGMVEVSFRLGWLAERGLGFVNVVFFANGSFVLPEKRLVLLFSICHELLENRRKT